MESLHTLITKLKTLKEEHKQHNFTEDQIQMLAEAIEFLENAQRRDEIKEYTEIGLSVVSAIKLIVDLFS